MLTIKIANTEAFEYLKAFETEERYNGEDRRTLTITCMPDVISVDVLNAILTEENLASVALINDELGVTNYHDGYVMKLECGIKTELVRAHTSESAAVYEDRLVIKLGRRNYRDIDARNAVAVAERAEAQATYTAIMTDTLLEV